ncbi:fructose-1,6-bisphosphatase [Mucilaginibacter conchicola]|uniref:Fructose-1,6-bisphosphatase class 1 n=1 Tax=Mucilaginibacter conchicola TaxID=2303333 RepID=A0A372NP96_9SPHI|nr:class 1 fructose-bisphosphatase [Mucilaginibacter conchicola]RFZ90063.1 fructose-1,6-bisphosphatase [Mucilaginibacter conchicola]
MPKEINLYRFMKGRNEDNQDLITALEHMSKAAIIISDQLAGQLHLMSPSAESINLHGEIQHYLDQFAEQQFLNALTDSDSCFAVISEEQEDYIQLSSALSQRARYIIALDPLDGSSNIDVNVPVGSIFSIYDRFKSASPNHPAAVLQDSGSQVAAGYFLYGPATMLVMALSDQVNGFTLDRSLHEFILSHPDIRIPENGSIYSVNDGNYHQFDRGTQNYLRFCRQQEEFYGSAFTARYIGSMVADIHRTLFRGGIFLYPATTAAPSGKLRLAYECRPMAYIIEKAGGLANSGPKNILEIDLSSPHQRAPVVMGSAEMVRTAQNFLNSSLPVTCEQSF